MSAAISAVPELHPMATTSSRPAVRHGQAHMADGVDEQNTIGADAKRVDETRKGRLFESPTN